MPDAEPKKEILIRGISAAPGIAHGPAFVFFQEGPHVPCYDITEEQFEEHERRFDEALLATRQEITRLRDTVAGKLGKKEAAIFDSHLLVLEDPALIKATREHMRATRRNIEHCFHEISGKYLAFFATIEDQFFKGRDADIRDVARRVLHKLLGQSLRTLAEISDKRVIVANDLTPSDTAHMSAGHALAMVTDGGNCTSHAVIMSRSLGIPAVVGALVATDKISFGDEVLVDGFGGLVYVNPSPDTLFHYGQEKLLREKFEAKVRAQVGLSEETADGKPFKLSANVNGVEDVPAAHENHARGVGLFRTESVFMKHPDHVPDEEAQYRYYADVIRECAPERVIVRTLDIGGDKPYGALLTTAGGPPEQNPFMGFRAIRFCLERKPTFRAHLRAILRASAHGSVKIMFPMISSLDELLKAKKFLAEVEAELRAEGAAVADNYQIGSMVEIPSAAVSAALLAEHCDFLSIGTNDLVQYMLAVDRGNGRIAHLYEPCNPAVLSVIRGVIEAGAARGKPVSICGELAGETAFAPLFIGLGAASLSMAPANIPQVRFLLRHCDSGELAALVAAVFAEHEPKKIQHILRAFAAKKLR